MGNHSNFGRRQLPRSAGKQVDDALMLRLVEEISAQRRLQEQQLAVTIRREQLDQRWRVAGRTLMIAIPSMLALFAYANSSGFQFGPLSEVVGVVHIEGEISSTSPASADRIIPVLRDAFANRNVTQVVLAIDSPGGAPVEAERISQAISTLRAKYPKPVVAAISNIGASAAYMIALHTDRIVAGKYSLVGSIGAVIAPWQVNQAMDKLGVSQRVYASGGLKSFLNPFTPVSPEAEKKAQELVDGAGGTFLAELVQARGRKLKQGVDYSSGEVWSGIEAKGLGLVDTIGTIDDFTTAKGARTHNFGPHPSNGSLWGRAFSQAVLQPFFVLHGEQGLQFR